MRAPSRLNRTYDMRAKWHAKRPRTEPFLHGTSYGSHDLVDIGGPALPDRIDHWISSHQSQCGALRRFAAPRERESFDHDLLESCLFHQTPHFTHVPQSERYLIK